jgi:hypothetical protein
MPMREECKFFESRTYRNGETVRKCDLDLAPEAPWRCPDHCQAYTPRMADVNWSYGTLVTPPTPPEPDSLGKDPSIGELLDEAEDIVHEAGPRIRAELGAQPTVVRLPKPKSRGLSRFFGRRHNPDLD